MTKTKNIPNLNKTIFSSLRVPDFYTLIMLALYTLFAIIFFSELKNAPLLILANVLLASFVVAIAYISEKYHTNKNIMLFRRIYVAPIIFVIYSQIHNYIPLVNPNLYDTILVGWDRSIFGTNPTEWIHRIANPALTEYLQFSYMLYFFMPLAHGIELHFRKKNEQLDFFSENILFAFYLSYLLYFFMPAIGPRFSIHDFNAISSEIPGLWLTEFFRGVVNNGGGIPVGAINPAAVVNRDCMPSGHTMMTLVNVYFVFKNKSYFRIPIFIFAMSLIFATIYLRYHYVVDIFAGAIFASFVILSEPYISKFINKITNKNNQSAKL
jgi:membrane-associated phospholipid phosphatase